RKGALQVGSRRCTSSKRPLFAADSPLATIHIIFSVFSLFSGSYGCAYSGASGAPFRHGGKTGNSPLQPPFQFCSYEMLTQKGTKERKRAHAIAIPSPQGTGEQKRRKNGECSRCVFLLAFS